MEAKGSPAGGTETPILNYRSAIEPQAQTRTISEAGAQISTIALILAIASPICLVVSLPLGFVLAALISVAPVPSSQGSPLVLAAYAIPVASPLLGIAGIVTGHVAWRRSEPGGSARGRSIAALALGYPSAAVALAVISLVAMIWLLSSRGDMFNFGP